MQTVSRNTYKTLKAIAEGYMVVGEQDRYIVVSNPDFQEDNGSDVNLVIDIEELRSES